MNPSSLIVGSVEIGVLQVATAHEIRKVAHKISLGFGIFWAFYEVIRELFTT